MEKYILVKKDNIQPFLESRDFYKCCYDKEENVYFVPEYLYEKVMLFNPKKGDFCVDEEGIIFICAGEEDSYSISEMCYLENDELDVSGDVWVFDKSECRYATEEEKQKLLKALKDAYYKYNEKSKSIIPIKWRANFNKEYFCIDSCFSVWGINDTYGSDDTARWNIDNYFQKREDAELVAQKFKEQLAELNKFHQ